MDKNIERLKQHGNTVRKKIEFLKARSTITADQERVFTELLDHHERSLGMMQALIDYYGNEWVRQEYRLSKHIEIRNNFCSLLLYAARVVNDERMSDIKSDGKSLSDIKLHELRQVVTRVIEELAKSDLTLYDQIHKHYRVKSQVENLVLT